MRSLTSIQSASVVKADLQFHLQASDQSTTWIFDRNDIAPGSITAPNWEIPYLGGMGRPSSYKITLVSSISFIKDNYEKMIKGDAFLKVFVNSDNFTPHVGRVRNTTQFADNPDMVELQVYDRFLDNNPQFPVQTIVDSFPGTHPEVINEDMGYPFYYGKHTRPFFMTPVDCSIDSLLGPRNVSSQNHVTSLFFNTNLSKSINLSELPLMKMTWNQQSGASNDTTSAFSFLLTGFNGAIDQNVCEFLVTPKNVGNTKQNAAFVYKGKYIGNTTNTTSLAGINFGHDPYLISAIPQKIKKTTGIRMSMLETGVGSLTQFRTQSIVESGNGQLSLAFPDVTSATNVFSADTSSGNGQFIITQKTFFNTVILGTITDKLTITYCCDLDVELFSDSYKNYSIFGSQVNCAQIAVSENPGGILKHVFDQSSVAFIASQNSQYQVDVTSFNMQCLFDVRRSITDIVNEFGEISAAYMWVGDSGFLNSRTYQQSADVSVNATINTSDFLENTFKYRRNPLGTTVFEGKKVRRINVNYEFDFQLGQFKTSNNADPTNNAFCNSNNAAGISKEVDRSTKYIMETATSSYYLGNLVRKFCMETRVVEMELPARFFSLELADVVKVQHPIIVGSESLFQIIKISPNYMKGKVFISANEILNL